MTSDDLLAELERRGLLRSVTLIARRYGVTPRALVGRGRTRAVSAARHEAMAYLKTHYPFSYPEIGRLFNRDHTTVMNGVRKAMPRLAPIEEVA